MSTGGKLSDDVDQLDFDDLDLEEDDVDDELKKKILSSLKEGKRMEAYAEHRTKDMKHCDFCEKISYKKVPGKEIGEKWICIDCLRRLKEILDNLEKWEEELALDEEMEDQLEEDLDI